MQRPSPILLILLGLLLMLAQAGLAARSTAPGQVLVAELEGAIGPASAAYVADAIAQAEAHGAALLVLRMDTPGGLDTSMRAIIKAINASAVPVATFVAPSGSRAASAGTYILYASHVAAMAPGTNLGAATPVQLIDLSPGSEDGDGGEGGGAGEDPMHAKLVNDAVAYIRSLAELRGRNAEWAERAVRGAESLPATEAVEIGVADVLASDLDALLAALDGRVVAIADGEVELATKDAPIVEIAPNWRSRLLAIITNPNVAYILMLVGIYGLVYEFANPGAVLPGTVGAVSLILALYAFHVLPVDYAGLALIFLGLALIIGEAFVPSFGALGIGGVVAFVVGSLMLIDTDSGAVGISLSVVVSFAVTSAVLLLVVVRLALQAHRRPVATGSEQLIGARARALSGFPGVGRVQIHGEVWSAHAEVAIAAGAAVRVVDRDGLVLRVEPEPD